MKYHFLGIDFKKIDDIRNDSDRKNDFEYAKKIYEAR
jgi:hypothetical protein